MKLYDLCKQFDEEGKFENNVLYFSAFTPEMLDQLKGCEEFANTEEIKQAINTGYWSGTVFHHTSAQMIKPDSVIQFDKEVHIWNIIKSPLMLDPSKPGFPAIHHYILRYANII